MVVEKNAPITERFLTTAINPILKFKKILDGIKSIKYTMLRLIADIKGEPNARRDRIRQGDC